MRTLGAMATPGEREGATWRARAACRAADAMAVPWRAAPGTARHAGAPGPRQPSSGRAPEARRAELQAAPHREHMEEGDGEEGDEGGLTTANHGRAAGVGRARQSLVIGVIAICVGVG